MKVRQLQRQRDNLIYAMNEMWPGVKPEHVVPSLIAWYLPGPCGAPSCFGGWVARDRFFIARGVYANEHGVPHLRAANGDDPVGHLVADYLFADSNLFCVRGDHIADRDAVDGRVHMPDHELVANRLRWLLENSEVVL